MSSVKQNFWNTLPKPFFALAPMADVTDAAFRRLIAMTRKPDVMWTEFVSADGLVHPIAKEKLVIDLLYDECERPLIAQLFTAHPAAMFGAARLCQELGFDGIDINMGCPQKNVLNQGAGCELVKNPRLARDIIAAAKEGAPLLPVSVKTRIGYHKPQIETWIPELLEEGIAALTVHLRTKKEMSKVPAHWELMPSIVRIARAISPSTKIIGNGDVRTISDAKEKARVSDCDGIMFGRAIFGNPWLFDTSGRDIPLRERLVTLIEHLRLFDSLLGKHKPFALMKKHCGAYVADFSHAKELRFCLMNATTCAHAVQILQDFLKSGTRN